jgi:hypothetical protein
MPPASPELIWMASDRTDPTPLDLLTHLLAGAVAQDLPYPVVIVTLSHVDGLRIEEWDGVRFVPSTQPAPALPITAARLRALIPAIVVGATIIHRGRVFVAHLDDPLHLPVAADPVYGFHPNTKFDRAVLVADAIPDAVSAEVRALLDPNLFVTAGVGFSGVVPSVLVQPDTATSFWQRWLGIAGLRFGARDEPEDDELQQIGPAGERVRLFRDTCFVPLDLDALANAWAVWDAGGRVTAFIDAIASPPPAPDPLVEGIHRWGRAATNRRVGVAVSGGGACAYRLAGLLLQLEDQGVPVDVLAGLSGGALIGAYYCTQGRLGLERAIRRGPLFGVLLPLATVSSWFIEKFIDFDLGSPRIQEARVRYVAVTAELPSGRAPRARVVSAGTVGEAVRVSGTLPPLFGPSKKGKARYTDGGAASLVPAEIVRNCGADLTVSYNVLAGPADGNPFSWMPFGIGDVIRDLPLLGRVIDVWVWYTFLWARASRQFGKFADVPIAFDQDAQMIEGMYWIVAGWVAQWGYDDPEVGTQVGVAKTKWDKLQIQWP